MSLGGGVQRSDDRSKDNPPLPKHALGTDSVYTKALVLRYQTHHHLWSLAEIYCDFERPKQTICLDRELT